MAVTVVEGAVRYFFNFMNSLNSWTTFPISAFTCILIWPVWSSLVKVFNVWLVFRSTSCINSHAACVFSCHACNSLVLAHARASHIVIGFVSWVLFIFCLSGCLQGTWLAYHQKSSVSPKNQCSQKIRCNFLKRGYVI